MQHYMRVFSMGMLVGGATGLQAMYVDDPQAFVLQHSMKYVVQLPPAEVLAQRLIALGDLGHFMQITGIQESLGNKYKHPLAVYREVELAIDDYLDSVNNELVEAYLYRIKSKIIKTILQGHPAGIKLLEEKGLLEREDNGAAAG